METVIHGSGGCDGERGSGKGKLVCNFVFISKSHAVLINASYSMGSFYLISCTKGLIRS